MPGGAQRSPGGEQYVAKLGRDTAHPLCKLKSPAPSPLATTRGEGMGQLKEMRKNRRGKKEKEV